ncbi:unnamed protein product [Diamesa hyperborea]
MVEFRIIKALTRIVFRFLKIAVVALLRRLSVNKTEAVDINAFTHIAFRFFKIVGFDPVEKVSVIDTKMTWIAGKLKCLYSFLVVLCLLTNQVLMIIHIVLNHGDIKKIINALPPLGLVGLVAVKNISITRNNAKFNNVLNKLTEMYPLSKDDQEKFQVQRYYKGFKLIQNIYFYKTVIFSVVLFIIVPFFNFIVNDIWIHQLPVEIWFPFDPYQNLLNFNCVLVWHFSVYFYVTSYLLGTDLICFAFITIIEMYFDNLKDDLMNLKDSSEISGETKLKELIERHETLISVSNDLETIFSPAMLLNFVASSILICIVSFQILFATDTPEMMKFLGVFTTTTAQILVICHFGNKLICSSAGVAEGAYNCTWYDSRDSKFKFALHMIIVRAQRPNKLTAMGFSTVCLESFCKVS